MSYSFWVKVFLSFFVFFFFMLFPQKALADDKLVSYELSICASICSRCSASDLKPFPNLYDICKEGVSFANLTSCTNTCLSNYKDQVFNAAKTLKNSCETICNNCKTPNSGEDYSLNNECISINQNNDPVKYFMSAILPSPKDGVCPTGATANSDGKCQCSDQNAVFDSLQTICLNKDTVIQNINTLLLFLPDDILTAIKQKAQDQVVRILFVIGTSDKSVNDSANDLSKFVADKLLDENALANFIYENYIQNTQNLRDLVKSLGKSKTEKLISLLQLILNSKQEQKSQDNKVSYTKAELMQLVEKQFTDHSAYKESCENTPAYKKCSQSCEDAYGTDLTSVFDCRYKCSVQFRCLICYKDSDCANYYSPLGLKAQCHYRSENNPSKSGTYSITIDGCWPINPNTGKVFTKDDFEKVK